MPRRPSPARSAGAPSTGAPSTGAPSTGAPSDVALARAAEVMGDRWSLLVVARLLHGPRRFGELLDELDGLAPNILSRRLARLEGDGLVIGEPYSTRPVRHSYRLTAPGAELADALRMLAGWAARRSGIEDDLVVPRHETCGSALSARWYCPTCDRAVDHAGGGVGAGVEPAGTRATPGGGDPTSDGLVWM